MAKKKPAVEKDTAERWLLTYADLMNLLLIFFIILYAMSSVDKQKFDQLAASLKAAFGNSAALNFINSQSGGANSLVNLVSAAPPPSSVIPANTEDARMQEAAKEVNELVKKENLSGLVDVRVEERGVVISVRARLLFKSGSSEIEEISRKTINNIGTVLKKMKGNHIRVEGHTDNDPITSSQFPSNWELSSVRATNIVRMLIGTSKIDPNYISAVGYGEFRPKVPNTTEANKAENRRVDIVIVKNTFDKSEPAASPKPPAVPPDISKVMPAGGGEAH